MRRQPPGRIRDAIVDLLAGSEEPMSLHDIVDGVSRELGATVPASSVRSYLRLNVDSMFERVGRGRYQLQLAEDEAPRFLFDGMQELAESNRPILVEGDCMAWCRQRAETSVHAVVTDPPYGLYEYSPAQQEKLRAGRGGVWRIPPAFDGHKRSPLPRFTTLTEYDLHRLDQFFVDWGRAMFPILVPGANVIIASQPLVSDRVARALVTAGFENRGAIVRLVMTMRGGDRPKNAHDQFPDVSVMPRSMWEPWLCLRRPLDGRVQDNLRRWRTGGFRRISPEKPFGDVILSQPTRAAERRIARHPSLKPQSFLRRLVRAVLPLGEGIVLDPFAGAGSTLAAAWAVGYKSIGIEIDPEYARIALEAIEPLARLRV